MSLQSLPGLKRLRWEGPGALEAGKHTLEFDFKYEGLGPETLEFNNMSGIGQPGTGVLKVDGKELATQKLDHTIPIILQMGRDIRHWVGILAPRWTIRIIRCRSPSLQAKADDLCVSLALEQIADIAAQNGWECTALCQAIDSQYDSACNITADCDCETTCS